ncbi:hypothetical protein VTI74DRAFT_3937 [Chaetomium olivicolor]
MGSTGPATSPSNDSAPPSCPLEGLNVDCVVAILSEINSLADLGAFIRTSPGVFACFLSAKASILVRVLTHELGPAVRDALILCYTENIDMLAAETIDRTLEIAVGGYRQCLLTDKWPWVPAQDIDTAVGMARVARVALYFADLYIRQQIPLVEHALDYSAPGGWSVSQTERRRIAQSLLRLQVIAGLYYPTFHEPGGDDYFFASMVTLFKGWEMEQVSEMADFVSNLIEAFRKLDRQMPRCVSSQVRDYYSNHYHKIFFFNLPAFSAILVAAQREDDQLMPKLMAMKDCKVKLLVRWLETSRCGEWRMDIGTRPPAAVLALLKLPVEDAAGQVEFNRESPTDPPWAWVHAWNGKQVNRWGLDLVPAFPYGGSYAEHRRASDLMKSWRSLGLVFWDKDHAEELLRAKALEGCRAGWLWSHLTSGPPD